MADIRPFVCVRPREQLAETIAALPYDVYSRAEAKEIVRRNPKSFLAIDRAETQLADDVGADDPRVFERAAATLHAWMDAGDFVREPACYYVYELTRGDRTQAGIVAVSSVDDYLSGVIRKHENTRADKEAERIRHIKACGAQTGPIFLAYRADAALRAAAARAREREPLYSFTSDDGVRHRVFAIHDAREMENIRDAFSRIEGIYIADGHHRAASAVKVAQQRRAADPGYTGHEPYNYFLSVLFPDDELMIMDYNRVVHDLNGYDEAAFLAQLKSLFDVRPLTNGTIEESGVDETYVRPRRKGEFSVFSGGRWYRCGVNPADISADPVDGLDVSLLQNLLLAPVLGIGDPRTDSRIGFVGGVRGLKELERRCRSDAAAAFAMYPTSMAELFAVADAGRLMPPKSTWFEPKLRSGLFIHEIGRT